MSEFQPVYPEISSLDPHKRVRYSNGLVLGVDEFEQEQLYLLEKQRLHNRALHGYGTVCGLNVSLDNPEGVWKLIVGPGIAVDIQGKDIRVPQAQCADLNTWLFNHRERVEQILGSPPIALPADISLYLVLCYDECDTDFVPIPSGPCQSLDKTSVASRTADHFMLDLRTDAPEQVEEEQIQRLIQLLRDIAISEAPNGLQAEHIRQLVLSLLDDVSPPVFSPPLPSMHMSAADAEELIRTAFRIWVTEVKPELLPSGSNCASGPPTASCILLSRLDLSIEDTGSDTGFRLVSGSTPELFQNQRPYLLQTRLLQEHILQCCIGEATGGGGGGGGGGGSIDESNLMHLTGNETVEGQKTFTDPLSFDDDGRFRKRIMLSPSTALILTPASVSHEAFRAGIPALSMQAGSEVSFNITVPDDIQYSVTPRLRICWGFTGPTGTIATVSYEWRVRNRFADPGIALTTLSGGPANYIIGSETNAEQSRVYVTDWISLSDAVAADDIFGAIRIVLNSLTLPAGLTFYLLHAELNYVSNRLGRPL